MKRYTNIPLKERKRNADRMYRHEATLYEKSIRNLIKDKFQKYERDCDEVTSDKDREANEVYARLKALEKSEGGE